MTDQANTFVTRALAPDNDLIINQIIDLFQASYGNLHPNRNVYSQQYWRSHIITRFISLAMYSQGRMVAHIALLPDSNDPSIAQIVFPAIHPQFKHFEAEMNPVFREVVLRLAARKAWHTVFYYDYVGSPTSATFTLPILGEIDTAIAPGYFPRLENNKNETQDGVRSFNQNGGRFAIQVKQALLNGAVNGEHTLYVPSRHLEFVKYLYQPFNLKRTFETEASSKGNLNGTLAADSPAYFDEVFPPIQARHIFVQPSLITEAHRMSLYTQDADTKSSFVFVNLRDPAAPAFCDELESREYKFCGVMPYFFGRENIIFYLGDAPPLEIDLIAGERAQTLAKYMEKVAVEKKPFGRASPKGAIYAAAVRNQ